MSKKKKHPKEMHEIDVTETILSHKTHLYTLASIAYLQTKGENYNEKIAKYTHKRSGSMSDQLDSLEKAGLLSESEKKGRIRYVVVNYEGMGQILRLYCIRKANKIIKEMNEYPESYSQKIWAGLSQLNTLENPTIITEFGSNQYLQKTIELYLLLIADMMRQKGSIAELINSTIWSVSSMFEHMMRTQPLRDHLRDEKFQNDYAEEVRAKPDLKHYEDILLLLSLCSFSVTDTIINWEVSENLLQ